jgi:predicted Zn-dependent protease
VRDDARTLDFARRASEAAPENSVYLGTYGAAHARTGEHQRAIELLQQSLKSDSGDRARDLLFLAACREQLGDRDAARKELADATEWISQHRPGNQQLKHLAAEVARSIESSPPASTPAEQIIND